MPLHHFSSVSSHKPTCAGQLTEASTPPSGLTAEINRILNLSLLGGTGCAHWGTSGCAHLLVDPLTSDPWSQYAALCRIWWCDRRGVSPTSSLSIRRQEEEEMVQSLFTDRVDYGTAVLRSSFIKVRSCTALTKGSESSIFDSKSSSS